MSARKQVTPTQPGRRRSAGPSARRRMVVVVSLLVLVSAALVARAFDLQVVRKQFYQRQGDARFLREVPIPVSRGTIFDRNGEPLAVSTPMMSIWANPSEVLDNDDRIPALAQALGVDARMNGAPLHRPPFALLQSAGDAPAEVVSGPRIGISKAVSLPWRFGLKGSLYVSRRFS